MGASITRNRHVIKPSTSPEPSANLYLLRAKTTPVSDQTDTSEGHPINTLNIPVPSRSTPPPKRKIAIDSMRFLTSNINKICPNYTNQIRPVRVRTYNSMSEYYGVSFGVACESMWPRGIKSIAVTRTQVPPSIAYARTQVIRSNGSEFSQLSTIVDVVPEVAVDYLDAACVAIGKDSATGAINAVFIACFGEQSCCYVVVVPWTEVITCSFCSVSDCGIKSKLVKARADLRAKYPDLRLL